MAFTIENFKIEENNIDSLFEDLKKLLTSFKMSKEKIIDRIFQHE